MQQPTQRLPPNPYTRQPIKKKDQLAGRRQELNEIRYYLNLTTVGQSYHLALIGARGSGKTSLLNAAEGIARELKLLPIRMDLNEGKASTPGHFWHDLYATLLLACENAQLWNGHSTIYSALFQMIHGRSRPDDISSVVLRTPFVFASHNGPLGDMICPDALIIHDLNTINEECRNRDRQGLVVLIDEADCLGQNRPLIQMFRNIFQRVVGCSLVLAGTENVFPTLTDVFSPIPRQFHRICVKAFSHPSDTRDLVFQPSTLGDDDPLKDILPADDVVWELHKLCGGAPDELQLYCHHMYKQVENHKSTKTPLRMALTPQVFREVLNEYRATTPAEIDTVLDSVESLPEKLLCGSPWLSRRNLGLAENIRCAVFEMELELGRVATKPEEDTISNEIKGGYQQLHNYGITQHPDRLDFVGKPLTDGFWKSFVEVEKQSRWIWTDESFSHVMVDISVGLLVRGNKGFVSLEMADSDQLGDALTLMRSKKPIGQVDSRWLFDLQIITSIARQMQVDSVFELIVSIECAGRTQRHKCVFNAKCGLDQFRHKNDEWLLIREQVFAHHRVMLRVEALRMLTLPNDSEIHRLGWIAASRVFTEYGPSDMKWAFDAYLAGNVAEAAVIFQQMLLDRDEPNVRNNLAFCLMLRGSYVEAKGLYENGVWPNEENDWPIWRHNQAVLLFVLGEREKAVEALQEVLAWIDKKGAGYQLVDADSMLVIDPTVGRVKSHNGLPVGVAIILNLKAMSVITAEEARKRLSGLHPESWSTPNESQALRSSGGFPPTSTRFVRCAASPHRAAKAFGVS